MTVPEPITILSRGFRLAWTTFLLPLNLLAWTISLLSALVSLIIGILILGAILTAALVATDTLPQDQRNQLDAILRPAMQSFQNTLLGHSPH